MTETIEVAGRDIRVTNPDKVYFPRDGITKMDLVEYWVSVAEAALVGVRDRPTTLHRFPGGVGGDGFYQKRVPKGSPEWVETVTIRFPSGRTADEVVCADAAHLAWMATLGCLEVNPWAVRADDVDHPDELRVDLDPTPRVRWASVRKVALLAREVLVEHGLEGWPKTSGKRGIHIAVPIEPRWGFTTVRRAALALSREVERRTSLATTAWWKEERRGVFLDYNQNARDRTVAAAYSVRPVPDARVSAPLRWDEVPDVEPADFTLRTMPARLRAVGNPLEGLEGPGGPGRSLEGPGGPGGSLEGLLELADRDERDGLGDAPWPPNFPKGDDEPVRAPPSRRRH